MTSAKTIGKWDYFFKQHLKSAQEKDINLNDSIGTEWGGTVQWLERYILPFIPTTEPVICEVGPGSGRFSRHLLDKSKFYYFVDYSDYVCELLKKNFGKRDNVRVIKSVHSNLELIGSSTVDFAFSIGTFVHLFIEQIYGYFTEFHRILKEGGCCVIHFANFMDDGGYDYFLETLPKNKQYDNHSVFRFYHPEMLEKMAAKIGFSVMSKQYVTGMRHCFMTLKK
jgi:ubiquinone/menaquinone biosynthesis C-methylase UbiE